MLPSSSQAPAGPLALDGRSLERLKLDASRDPQGAVRQAAGQFEALFTQMLLKSMRDATPKSGMFDGPGQDTYQSMLDAQLAQATAGRPGGLADMLARQLMRNMPQASSPEAGAGVGAGAVTGAGVGVGAGAAPGGADRGMDEGTFEPALPSVAGLAGRTEAAVAAARAVAGLAATGPAGRDGAAGNGTGTGLAADGAAAARGTGIPLAAGGSVAGVPSATGLAGSGNAVAAARAARNGGSPERAAFVDKLWAPAMAAQRATGVPAGFIVGQAALETGWGRSEMRTADGRSAHNLFGVKAGASWKGPTVDLPTTEYVGGRAVRTVARFRAYGSYEEAFRDWASLVGGSPRYAQVVRSAGTVEGFAQGLQRAGYATDPNYAEKLARTIHQALQYRRTVV